VSSIVEVAPRELDPRGGRPSPRSKRRAQAPRQTSALLDRVGKQPLDRRAPPNGGRSRAGLCRANADRLQGATPTRARLENPGTGRRCPRRVQFVVGERLRAVARTSPGARSGHLRIEASVLEHDLSYMQDLVEAINHPAAAVRPPDQKGASRRFSRSSDIGPPRRAERCIAATGNGASIRDVRLRPAEATRLPNRTVVPAAAVHRSATAGRSCSWAWSAGPMGVRVPAGGRTGSRRMLPLSTSVSCRSRPATLCRLLPSHLPTTRRSGSSPTGDRRKAPAGIRAEFRSRSGVLRRPVTTIAAPSRWPARRLLVRASSRIPVAGGPAPGSHDSDRVPGRRGGRGLPFIAEPVVESVARDVPAWSICRSVEPERPSHHHAQVGAWGTAMACDRAAGARSGSTTRADRCPSGPSPHPPHRDPGLTTVSRCLASLSPGDLRSISRDREGRGTPADARQLRWHRELAWSEAEDEVRSRSTTAVPGRWVLTPDYRLEPPCRARTGRVAGRNHPAGPIPVSLFEPLPIPGIEDIGDTPVGPGQELNSAQGIDGHLTTAIRNPHLGIAEKAGVGLVVYKDAGATRSR